eukprot:SAG31_NODE_378_length_16503_cov_28.830041_16_plen_60_part_00
MALRDAVPVPPRLQLGPNETSSGAEVVALETSWVSLEAQSKCAAKFGKNMLESDCAFFD